MPLTVGRACRICWKKLSIRSGEGAVSRIRLIHVSTSTTSRVTGCYLTTIILSS